MNIRVLIKDFFRDLFKSVSQLLFVFFVAFLVFVVVVPTYQEARLHATVAQTKLMMRDVGQALEAYRLDHHAYPPTVPLRDFAKNPSPTHGNWDDQYQPLEWARGLDLTTVSPVLTTPVAYMQRLPADPFINRGEEKEIPPAYFSFRGIVYGDKSSDNEAGWLLISPGPDGDYDIHNMDEVCNAERKLIAWKLRPVFYDPKYGANANGDLLSSKPKFR